ncbi:hypothetical protein ACROYT_G026411 [Oculina patagonica]
METIYQAVLCILVFCHQTWSREEKCNNKLGMESKRIPNENITASSAKSADHSPFFARVDGPKAWCSAPEDESPYLQILLDEEKFITAITTQGSIFDLCWARKYKVEYFEKGKWKPYRQELVGNRNSGALRKNKLDPVIRTKSIRIYPKEPFSVMLAPTDPVPSCLRLELHGCLAPAGLDACDCHANATCENIKGSIKCMCKEGFLGDGKNSCEDVNECENPNACPVQSSSSCVNSLGSYRCNCLPGWRNRDPRTCVDINECSEGSYSCPTNSSCLNTQGAYQCQCNPCYYMSNNTCHGDCRLEQRCSYVIAYTSYKAFYTVKCGIWGWYRCNKSKYQKTTKRTLKCYYVSVPNRIGASCPCEPDSLERRRRDAETVLN